MSDVIKERPLKVRNLLAYGVGDIFGGGSFLIIGMLFMFFLTEVVGLSPIMAGLVFAIGKGWDAISDPLMGYISDRTNSRFGRRRVYFLVGILPIAGAFVLMWLPLETQSQWALFAYYSFAYVLFSTVFTMVMVPYAALNAEMTWDYKVRSRLSGSRMVFSGIASLLGGGLPHIIINQFPGDKATGYLVMSVVFGLLFALPFLIVFFGTWELPSRDKECEDQSLSIFKEFFSIMKNRSFRVHISMYICSYTAMDVLMALFAYFLTFYLGKPKLFSVAIVSLLGVQILMLPVYVFIGNKKGKGFAYMVGLAIWLIGMALSLSLNAESSVAHIALVCATIGLGTSAGVLIPWAILPSIIDVDELISGQMRSGIYSGAMTLLRKLIQGVFAMPLIGFTLEAIGFVSKQATQSPDTVANLKVFFLAGPGALVFFGILVATRFRINPKTHAVLKGELERLAAGGSKDAVTQKAKKVCEELTGIPYEDLYPKKG